MNELAPLIESLISGNRCCDMSPCQYSAAGSIYLSAGAALDLGYSCNTNGIIYGMPHTYAHIYTHQAMIDLEMKS